MITEYLAGTVATMILFAVRTPNTEVRTVAVIASVWPISLIVIALVMLLDVFGWDIDVRLGQKMWGFRRPTNPGVRGFAMSVFGAEVQVWKGPKV